MRLFALLSILASLTVQGLAARAEDIVRIHHPSGAHQYDANLTVNHGQDRARANRRIDEILKIDSHGKGEDSAVNHSGSSR